MQGRVDLGEEGGREGGGREDGREGNTIEAVALMVCGGIVRDRARQGQ